MHKKCVIIAGKEYIKDQNKIYSNVYDNRNYRRIVRVTNNHTSGLLICKWTILYSVTSQESQNEIVSLGDGKIIIQWE
jgi:hypothetical protein